MKAPVWIPVGQARFQEISGGSYLAAVAGLEPVEFGPLEIDTDLQFLHRWFASDYGKFWGLGGIPQKELRSILEEKAEATNPRFWVVRHLPSRQPIYIHITYDPVTDLLASHLPVQTGDVGAHSFVAPFPDRLGYSTNVLLYLADAFCFLDPSVTRILREPDIRNRAMIRRRLQLGYSLGNVVHLPQKIAQVSYQTRKGFMDVDLLKLPPVPALSLWPCKVFFHRVHRFVFKRLAAVFRSTR